MNYFLSCFLLLSVSYFALVGAQTCPSGGILCWPSDCCTQYKQCSGTTFWPAQAAPSGTVCLQGQFVWPAQCTTPCSSNPPAPTSAPPTNPAPTNKPSNATTVPTVKPNPTTAPTVKPNPTATPSSGGSCSLSSILTQTVFNTLFPKANGGATAGLPNQAAIFLWSAIIQAASYYPAFACTGDANTRLREVAAFLAQTSQETSGWWAGQPYIWGFYYSSELNPPSNYCGYSADYPCVAGQSYFGRGPIQLSYNYNYGQMSVALFNDKTVLLNNPGEVLSDPVVAWRTALWFWMTTQSPKPSCHDVITGVWTPSATDVSLGRSNSFGMVTNIVNGGIECLGATAQPGATNRAGYYKTYRTYFGFPDNGENLDCTNMKNYS